MSDTKKKPAVTQSKPGLNGGNLAGLQSSAASIFELALENGLKFEDVEVPELGKGVLIRVRELTGFEREQFDRKIATVTSSSSGNTRGRKRRGSGESGGTNIEYHAEKIRLELCFMCCINDKNERLFNSPEDKKRLGDLSATLLERLFKRIMILSEMAQEDDDDDYDEDGEFIGKPAPVEVAQGES